MHNQGYSGKGIGIAVLDTGICEHPDFISFENRIAIFKDFVNYKNYIYDDNSHGSHVSGIIAGNGFASNGTYCGIAPKAHIISLKVLDKNGRGNIENVLKALKWILENRHHYNIRIVNISVGSTSYIPDEEDSILVHAVNKLWDEGLVVVAAAGNGGPMPQSIGTPGISRKIITVGSCDDEISSENNLYPLSKNYSGRGPTISCIKKPDIVAPGNHIISCNAVLPNALFSYAKLTSQIPLQQLYQRNQPQNYVYNYENGKKIRENLYFGFYTAKSGTSMATPMVSGAIALLLSKYPNLSNKDIKIRLKNTSTDLGLSHSRQGWGLLNIEKLCL